ncbi:unnamed protein product [Owenia fusiformis]|uniref:Intimal thickness related receptor IRP domain-containing protein n=1 Tax=Owenia fusiformis TaxID=6347 RepID=A0A8J1UBS4_OWEFU|nr:unnamed protein product [Owenia fusiformis]
MGIKMGSCILGIFLTVLCLILEIEAKTTKGIFSTRMAQEEMGQYVSTFCFHGETAIISYTLNSTGTTQGVLGLILDEDWHTVTPDTQCHTKLDLAKIKYELTDTGGNISMAQFADTKIWHIIYSDTYTCERTRSLNPLEKSSYIEFEIQMLNPDIEGEPTNHFSDEETGLLRFFQLLTLMYFILACIYTPSLQESLSKGGPMCQVLKLLIGALFLQAGGSLLIMLHLHRYSSDGYGLTFLQILSELLDVVSQFIMLYMVLSLTLGWTLGSHKNVNPLKNQQASGIVGTLGILQGLLFLWEQNEDQEFRIYHAHRSTAGFLLLLVRITLAVLFSCNLYTTVTKERSTLKREFYASFSKSCLLWFLCYPVLVVSSWLLTAYLRYKFIVMGMVICQNVAILFLYRLFLSRSLYWEVSALSSSIPLKMDKNFGIRIYS